MSSLLLLERTLKGHWREWSCSTRGTRVVAYPTVHGTWGISAMSVVHTVCCRLPTQTEVEALHIIQRLNVSSKRLPEHAVQCGESIK